MAARNEITSRYEVASSKAAEQDRKITPAQFMLASNPGSHRVVYKGQTYYSRYSNADSASRAYRKVKSGETSGEQMYKRSRLYTYNLAGTERGFRMDRPRGQYEMGLWKINIHMNWTDADGNVHEDEVRSFIARSYKYQSYFDTEALLADVDEAVEDNVAAWEDDYGVSNIEILYVEALRVQTTSKTDNAVLTLDLDG